MTLIERLRAAAPGTMLSMQVNDLAALREAADEIERLRQVEWAAQTVLKTFQDSEAAGYRTKDRQYAIEILGKFLNQQQPNKE